MFPLTNTPPARVSRGRVYASLMAILIACWTPDNVDAQVALRDAPTTATATGTTIKINAPAGVLQGDILIANIAAVGTSSAASLSGWTVIRSASLSTSPKRYATVLYRIAGLSEPASYSFSTGSGTVGASGGIVAFSGVDNSSPLDVASPTIRQATSTTVTATGVTTARTNTAIVFLGQAVGAAGGSVVGWNTSAWKTSSAPGALTELFDVQEVTNQVSVGAAWGTRTAIGATGNGTVTITSSVRNGGVLVALRAKDVFPPVVSAWSPSTGATGVAMTSVVTADFNEPMMASSINTATASLQAGVTQVPATVSYSTTGRRVTITPSSALRDNTTYTVTLKGGATGIRDLAGNALAFDHTWSFTTQANTVPGCPCNVFTTAQQTQAVSSATKNDGAGGIQVGMKFRASVDGYITGARFYKSASNTGTHIGQLWSSTGTLLAQATFTGETSSGWQQVSFANPVPVTANLTYVISYHSSAGNYAYTGSYFSGMTPNGPLRALSNGEDGGNGVYRYTNTPAFPSSTYSSSNYWVDVVFTGTTAGPDVTAPAVVSTVPTGNAVSVSVGTAIQASFSEPLNASTVTGTNAFIRQGTTGVAASVTYVSASQLISIAPAAALSAATTYTVTLKGGSTGITDVAGNALGSDYSWSFTTAETAPPPPPPPVGDNDIAAENARTGNPKSEWDISGAGDPSIQGFSTEMSVNRGSTVRFKINVTGTNAAYSIRIYRLGYYQGNGARMVADLGNFTGLTQPAPMVTASVGLVDCGNWSESASWSVPVDAVSGVYIAKLTRQSNGGSSHIVFIVRNDASTAPIMFKTSDATWQAYNSYGGYSFYTGTTSRPAGRADKISYNRPFDTRSLSVQDFVFSAEYPMIRWMERNGYHVTYVTDVDMERNTTPITPAKHKILLSVGHDEYWSANMRNNYETARNNGVHLAFFSGNEVYWKTRWENNNRTLVCYKEGATNQGENNCGGNCDPLDGVWTGLWRHGCEYGEDGCRPENALSGQISWTESYLPIQVPYEYRDHPFWRNTSIRNLQPGQVATLTDYTLGYEWDYENATYAAYYPPGRVTLSSTTFGGLTHKLSMYTHSSGAQVFGAGTVQWSWGLDNVHDRETPTPSFDMQQATVNLLYDMGVQPATPQAGIVLSAASGDQVPPASVISSPSNGATFQANQAVSISGTASDASGISRVDVSVNGGVSWQAASGTTNWSYSWTPTASGSYVVKSRAVDKAGNSESPGTPPSSNAITVTVNGGSTTNPCPCSVFGGMQPTGSTTENDGSALSLGMKFIPGQSGYITALRFYKAAANTGTHTGQLYSSSGTLLASVVYTNETSSGWQQVALMTPVAVTAGATYLVSYHSSSGYYTQTTNYFASAVVNGLLTAPASGSSGGNGVYQYGASPGRPTSTWSAANYWVDVVFNTVLSSAPGNTSGQEGIVDARGALGREYLLGQSIPNPATGLTTIQYHIPERAHVRIALYDMQGRMVRVLLDASRDPGAHRLEFDTRSLGKGMYFYRMQANAFSASKRMIVE